MVTIIKPPMAIPPDAGLRGVFLGGSIENGRAEDWQAKAEKKFAKSDFILLNPRRDNWNPELALDPTPGTEFHNQVTWELQAQELAPYLIYNFIPGTISPITLLEVGLFHDKMAWVCCPRDYFRYGNVKIVADRYGMKFFEDFDDLLKDFGY